MIRGQLQNSWGEAHREWPVVCPTAAPLRYPKYDIFMMGRKLGHALDMHPHIIHIMIYSGPVECGSFFFT